MSVIGKLKGMIGNWLVGRGIKKGVKSAVVALVGIIGAAKVSGVEIDQQKFELWLSTAAIGIATTALNYIKVRFNISWL